MNEHQALKTFWRVDLGKKVALINPEQVISVELYKSDNDHEGVVIRLSKHLFYKCTFEAWKNHDVFML